MMGAATANGQITYAKGMPKTSIPSIGYATLAGMSTGCCGVPASLSAERACGAVLQASGAGMLSLYQAPRAGSELGRRCQAHRGQAIATESVGSTPELPIPFRLWYEYYWLLWCSSITFSGARLRRSVASLRRRHAQPQAPTLLVDAALRAVVLMVDGGYTHLWIRANPAPQREEPSFNMTNGAVCGWCAPKRARCNSGLGRTGRRSERCAMRERHDQPHAGTTRATNVRATAGGESRRSGCLHAAIDRVRWSPDWQSAGWLATAAEGAGAAAGGGGAWGTAA
jgi:hypothetical protein